MNDAGLAEQQVIRANEKTRADQYVTLISGPGALNCLELLFVLVMTRFKTFV